jgi:predicted nucleic acid-binding protein
VPTARAIEAKALSVIDASVLVDALVVSGGAGDAAREELRDVPVLEVPAIFRAEALSALRSLVARGELRSGRAATAVEQVRTVRAIRYPFEPFARRAWELRNNLSIYDAWYVALAEWLDTEMVSSDQALTSARGLRCRIRRPGE